jgi:hypothetical protein
MKRTSKEWTRKYKPTNVNETKRFLVFYFLENLFRKGHITAKCKNVVRFEKTRLASYLFTSSSPHKTKFMIRLFQMFSIE